MSLKQILSNLYCFQLLHKGKIYAYAFGYSRALALEHLQRIINFHNIPYTEITEKYKEIVVDNIVNKDYILLNTNFEIYKYSKVYKELKHLNTFITYKELSRKTGYSIFNIIRALKHNPFLILLPCHLVVNKDHRSKGYTPLGLEFREKLIRYSNDII